ncbi:MAG: potassium/proton antiporter [Oscillospiraceae bacterium]|nr:potassium/proton antiporter [Oscillospiraceae bacterium]
MDFYLLLGAIAIFLCVIFNRVSHKLGVPVLLAFIFIGMLFGSDGLVKIPFDNYGFAENICVFALIFIMFYGGFGTKWTAARPVAAKAIMMSTLGTVATAGLVGLFCHYVLKLALLESFLIGSVISSTDAASVFSVLRSKHLNLRENTASLLEVESGSNDPFSYMLTITILSLMNGNSGGEDIAWLLFAQLFFGLAGGFLIAYLAIRFFRRFRFFSAGFDGVFMVAVAIAAFALPEVVGGNGYLSAYITGIILGNAKINHKQSLVNFFDGLTGLMQMLVFFLLGLLAFPSQLPAIAPLGLAIALFLTLVARPIVTSLVLIPFRASFGQIAVVSWAGFRGAASIVFAIIAVLDPAVMSRDIFHLVFFIVLFSILVQGTLLPRFAKFFGMTDNSSDVMKTFTDYTEEHPVRFVRFKIRESHPWANNEIRNITLPPDTLIVLIIRNDRRIVPNGRIKLLPGDRIILGGKAIGRIDGVNLYERVLDHDDPWTDKPISQVKSGNDLIIMIKRREKIIIPKGNVKLRDGDILVINDSEHVRAEWESSDENM